MDTKNKVMKLMLTVIIAFPTSGALAMNNNNQRPDVVIKVTEDQDDGQTKTYVPEEITTTTSSTQQNRISSWNILNSVSNIVTQPKDLLVTYLQTILPENSDTNWLTTGAFFYLLAEATYGKFGASSSDTTNLTRVWSGIFAGMFLTGRLSYWWWNPNTRHQEFEQTIRQLNTQIEQMQTAVQQEAQKTNSLVARTSARVQQQVQQGTQALQQQIGQAQTEAQKGSQQTQQLLVNIQHNAQGLRMNLEHKMAQVEANVQATLLLQALTTSAMLDPETYNPQALRQILEQIATKTQNPMLEPVLRALPNSHLLLTNNNGQSSSTQTQTIATIQQAKQQEKK